MEKKALAINPAAGLYSNLGTLYFFEGHYSDAVPPMEKAVEMDAERLDFWGNLGDAYRWADGWQERAPQAYQRAVELSRRQLAMNPRDATLRSGLAEYLAKMADRTKALAEITQARRLAPNDSTVLYRAAMVYEIIGLRDQALSTLDLALQGGYSIDELHHDPEFSELRKDPRFEQMEKASAPQR